MKKLWSNGLTCIYHFAATRFCISVLSSTLLKNKYTSAVLQKIDTRQVPETQCKSAAPEIGEGGQDILAVRVEEENTICCKISDIIVITCDEQEGYRYVQLMSIHVSNKHFIIKSEM